jgi:DNA-binding HxlR family transcriptional regulator
MDYSESLGSQSSATSANWIKGKQRLAVLNAIRGSTTGRQIMDSAKREAPKLSFADLRRILRSYENSGYVRCINPEQQTGRIYSLTPKGLAAASMQFEDFEYAFPKNNTDWFSYASIARSKSQRAILETFHNSLRGHDRRTPTQIRKELISSHPISMSFLIGAIRRMETLGLIIRKKSKSSDDRLAFYSITPKGRIILELFRN